MKLIIFRRFSKCVAPDVLKLYRFSNNIILPLFWWNAQIYKYEIEDGSNSTNPFVVISLRLGARGPSVSIMGAT